METENEKESTLETPNTKASGTIIRVISAVVIICGLIVFFYEFVKIKTVTQVNYPVIASDNNAISIEPGTEEIETIKAENFFQKTKDDFVASKTDFVEADLTNMALRVWKNGEVAKEVKIVAKGKDNSWWETPSGLYKIKNKETNHFSSFGHVYQPWSMVFQGNFFIHGWPYYEGGEPVVSSYSGGCIRLETPDAESIFSLTDIGMPVLVYKQSLLDDGFVYDKKTDKSEVADMTASSYLVKDLNNGFVFYDKNDDQSYSIASLTKLVTALTAMEYVNLNNDIYVPAEALVKTTKPRFSANDMVSSYNLLFPLINESSNEAAEIFARNIGSKRFVSLMNDKAQAIGMKNSVFVDSSGVLYDNMSTASDLMTLAQYIKNDRPFIWSISNNLVKPQNDLWRYDDLENFNLIPEEPEFAGGKIGKYTEKESMVAIFKVKVGESDRNIGIVVIDSDNAKADIIKLIDLVKSKYQTQK